MQFIITNFAKRRIVSCVLNVSHVLSVPNTDFQVLILCIPLCILQVYLNSVHRLHCIKFHFYFPVPNTAQTPEKNSEIHEMLKY